MFCPWPQSSSLRLFQVKPALAQSRRKTLEHQHIQPPAWYFQGGRHIIAGQKFRILYAARKTNMNRARLGQAATHIKSSPGLCTKALMVQVKYLDAIEGQQSKGIPAMAHAARCRRPRDLTIGQTRCIAQGYIWFKPTKALHVTHPNRCAPEGTGSTSETTADRLLQIEVTGSERLKTGGIEQMTRHSSGGSQGRQGPAAPVPGRTRCS